MPIDTPINIEESTIDLSQLEDGDKVTVTYQSSDGTKGEFDATVTRTSTFDGGTEVTLTQNTKIYGDFYPPIVRTPDGDELRLYKITEQ